MPFCFWLPHAAGTSPQREAADPAALRRAIRSHLSGLGWPGAEPLRWAITAVDPTLGLRLEGIGVHHAPPSHTGR